MKDTWSAKTRTELFHEGIHHERQETPELQKSNQQIDQFRRGLVTSVGTWRSR